ncbi:hypothetical protein FY557_16180 [Chryseobacterium sp. SN22]|uniref:hypothetical protein n=1 Tax=Chryseobacterium sp. SN22 TaxID=2606431 RepID=UPI0011ED705D|nr:hypothetical protein [Chryseobacterium sp. SN22]KAA0126712.1 hypothetical protein FY557_16180 [Chryseobacterium sp. SN22]
MSSNPIELMKNLISLIIFLILFSCTHKSSFDLERDLYQFSDKMENGDTLEVKVNHSACLFLSHELYTFVKHKDTVFLQTYSEISSFEKREQTLPKIVYNIRNKNRPSFENYFKYLSKEDKPKTETNSPLVVIYYKNKAQSKSFYDDGLEDKFEKLDRFGLLRQKIYHEDTFFKSPEPPPPPEFTK